MLPGPFRIAHRSRPVRLVSALPPGDDPRPPSRAIEVALTGTSPTVTGYDAGAVRIEGWFDPGSRRTGLDVLTPGGRRHRHTSRRSGRADGAEALGVTLTGDQATVLTRVGTTWTVRARADLRDHGLRWDPRVAVPLHAAGGPPVLAEGRFGQLGLRDLHLVTDADGEPYRRDGALFLTATHAGPGFFGTAHCGVWRFDPDTFALTHQADLWFERDGSVHGDHAVHLVRDEGAWLVLASTWGDFDHDAVAITWCRSGSDLLTGEHVLTTRPLDLSGLADGSVGVWDPHLTRIDGHWHLAFVAASRFFVFRPVLARSLGPEPHGPWELLGDARDRTATEGTQIVRLDGSWRVLASDGPDSPSRMRRRFPVFDLTMTEVAALDAEYPTNLPWPSLVEHRGRWLMVTFDGTPHGGRVAGYGTHGDLLVLTTEGRP